MRMPGGLKRNKFQLGSYYIKHTPLIVILDFLNDINHNELWPII